MSASPTKCLSFALAVPAAHARWILAASGAVGEACDLREAGAKGETSDRLYARAARIEELNQNWPAGDWTPAAGFGAHRSPLTELVCGAAERHGADLTWVSDRGLGPELLPTEAGVAGVIPEGTPYLWVSSEGGFDHTSLAALLKAYMVRFRIDGAICFEWSESSDGGTRVAGAHGGGACCVTRRGARFTCTEDWMKQAREEAEGRTQAPAPEGPTAPSVEDPWRVSIIGDGGARSAEMTLAHWNQRVASSVWAAPGGVHAELKPGVRVVVTEGMYDLLGRRGVEAPEVMEWATGMEWATARYAASEARRAALRAEGGWPEAWSRPSQARPKVLKTDPKALILNCEDGRSFVSLGRDEAGGALVEVDACGVVTVAVITDEGALRAARDFFESHIPAQVTKPDTGDFRVLSGEDGTAWLWPDGSGGFRINVVSLGGEAHVVLDAKAAGLAAAYLSGGSTKPEEGGPTGEPGGVPAFETSVHLAGEPGLTIHEVSLGILLRTRHWGKHSQPLVLEPGQVTSLATYLFCYLARNGHPLVGAAPHGQVNHASAAASLEWLRVRAGGDGAEGPDRTGANSAAELLARAMAAAGPTGRGREAGSCKVGSDPMVFLSEERGDCVVLRWRDGLLEVTTSRPSPGKVKLDLGTAERMSAALTSSLAQVGRVSEAHGGLLSPKLESFGAPGPAGNTELAPGPAPDYGVDVIRVAGWARDEDCIDFSVKQQAADVSQALRRGTAQGARLVAAIPTALALRTARNPDEPKIAQLMTFIWETPRK